MLATPSIPNPLGPEFARMVASSIESTSPAPNSGGGTRCAMIVAPVFTVVSPARAQFGMNLLTLRGCRTNPPLLVSGLKLPSLLSVPKKVVRIVLLYPPFAGCAWQLLQLVLV